MSAHDAADGVRSLGANPADFGDRELGRYGDRDVDPCEASELARSDRLDTAYSRAYFWIATFGSATAFTGSNSPTLKIAEADAIATY